MERLFRYLLLQFIEDLSDRELQKMRQKNTAAKLFCGFKLKGSIPDHTVFTRTRIRINNLSKMLTKMRDQ